MSKSTFNYLNVLISMKIYYLVDKFLILCNDKENFISKFLNLFKFQKIYYFIDFVNF